MPALHKEIDNAQEEGAIFKVLTTPVKLDENGWVRGMKYGRMELEEPDERGPCRPFSKPGAEFVIEVANAE